MGMLKRRNFLKLAGSTAALMLAAAGWAVAADSGDGTVPPGPSSGEVPRRVLGHTGEQVSIVGIGGHHLGRALVEESESIRIVRTALDNGVNFLDNSWDHNDGKSETRVGKALRDGYRGKAFVMTKIDGCDKASATRQIDESLRRLQTDRIDLKQFHEVIGAGRRAHISSDERLRAGRASLEDGKNRRVGRVRTLQNQPDLRFDLHPS